jgi:hypothetical protein
MHWRAFISRSEQVHAFCLMSHYFHLVVEAPRANLSASMPWFLESERRWEEVAAWVVLGRKTFRQELLDRIGKRRTRAQEGPEIRESEEQKAEGLIGGMLRQAGWKEGELEKRAKVDKAKARIAERLGGETTENGVQRNASRFETEKNANTPIVISDPFATLASRPASVTETCAAPYQVVLSSYTRRPLNEVVATDAVTIRANIWDAKSTSIC